MIFTFIGHDVIDFSVREGKPVYQTALLDTMIGLGGESFIEVDNFLRKNELETYDILFNPLSTPTLQDTFYDIGASKKTHLKVK